MLTLENIVGREFVSHDGKRMRCAAADHRDITLVSVVNADDVRLVSDRAIGRTFHEIYVLDGREFSAFGPVRT